MSLVLDSSVTLSWCFVDERTPATRAVLDRVVETGAVAPQIWPLETLNALFMAERRGRVDPHNRPRLVDFLRDLPVELDAETNNRVWTATQRLADRFRLTVYDAAYLELAERLRLPLASLDKDLRQAATAIGLSLLGGADD